ncbi:MAG: zf-HC2 domain-containing protein [Pseudomonadota bacterium]
MMLTCKQASQLISKSLDRELNWRERFALHLHVSMCKYCKRFSQQLLAMRIALKRMSKSIENDQNIQLPSETKSRITNSIESRVD